MNNVLNRLYRVRDNLCICLKMKRSQILEDERAILRHLKGPLRNHDLTWHSDLDLTV